LDRRKKKNMNTLQKEITVYRARLPQLQHDNPNGGFVVIKGDDILGVWNDRIDALRAGISAYGNVSFLVKNIEDAGKVLNFTRDFVFA
jgi:hypothetical protein